MATQVSSKIIESLQGGSIYAESVGDASKQAVVFAHGMTLSCQSMDTLFNDDALREQFHLVRYDLRGHGQSQEGSAVENITGQTAAADFKAVCKAFNIEQPPVLVGWSLGASIAVDLIAEDASALKAVVYLSALPWIGPIMKSIGRPELQAMLPGVMSVDNVELSNATAAKFVDSLSARPIEQRMRLSLLGSTTLSKPAVRKAWVSRAQDPAALVSAVSTGKLPLLMIHGKEDIQVDGPALQDQLEQTFGKEHFSVKIVDGAGHGVHLDEAQQVVDAILAFVK